jgi:hypothetical protein
MGITPHSITSNNIVVAINLQSSFFNLQSKIINHQSSGRKWHHYHYLSSSTISLPDFSG